MERGSADGGTPRLFCHVVQHGEAGDNVGVEIVLMIGENFQHALFPFLQIIFVDARLRFVKVAVKHLFR